MKYKFLKYTLLIGVLNFTFISCDDFLDADELNDRITIEEVLRFENDAIRFLAALCDRKRAGQISRLGLAYPTSWMLLTRTMEHPVSIQVR